MSKKNGKDEPKKWCPECDHAPVCFVLNTLHRTHGFMGVIDTSCIAAQCKMYKKRRKS